MKLKSQAFTQGSPIPKKYTGEGTDVSPPLSITDVPTNTKTIVVIMDDPDAPMGTFDHWIAWNIPSTTTEITEGATIENLGSNHFKDLKYRGPMPPPGSAHRYFFKAYALDTSLDLPRGATKGDVENAMQGHIVEKAELMGTYQRT